jgi:hypothetical protein
MNDKLEQCCKSFTKEIKAAEAHLDEVSRHVEMVSKNGLEDVEVRLKEAEEKCEASRKRAGEAGQHLKQLVEEKIGSAVSRLEDWKIDRDIAKVEARADRKELYAVSALVFAAFAIQEAEVALLKALAARKFANEVAG